MRAATMATVVLLLVAIGIAASDPKPGITTTATNGAFRDGLYVGKLAAKRGARIHISYARWAKASDRSSFTTGYEQGYTQQMASTGPRQSLSTVASYQDGLYLGRFDASQGKAQHVAAGRWSNTGDRASFTTGYLRGYDTASELVGGNSQRALRDVAAARN